MSICLLYCILDADPDAPRPFGLAGIDDAPVFETTSSGLAAAVSRLDSPPGAHIRTLTAFADVVEKYHAARTVIPLRFGTCFENEEAVSKVLRNRAETYGAVLKKLAGCSEMGIRILGRAPVFSNTENRRKTSIPKTGKDFLLARKASYDAMEGIPAEIENELARIKKILSETYTEVRRERRSTIESELGDDAHASNDKILVSLFFLVPDHCLEKFRSLCRAFRFEGSCKMFLSGPWPPFNFVSDAMECGDR